MSDYATYTGTALVQGTMTVTEECSDGEPTKSQVADVKTFSVECDHRSGRHADMETMIKDMFERLANARDWLIDWATFKVEEGPQKVRA